MEYNKIPVTFRTRRRASTEEINYRYDIKQVLVIDGIDELPEYFRVDFCNEGDSSTKPMIGTAAGVEIPDEYLLTGKPIKAYIVLSGTGGDVQTRYEIDIPVRLRPPNSGETPTPEEQSVIDQLIAALNAGVAEAEQSAEDAEASAEDSEAWAKGTRKGEAVTEEDETYQNNAAYFADQAGRYAGGAGASAQRSEDAALAAIAAKNAAGRFATDAETAKNGAVEAKNQAQNIVDGASAAIEQKKTEAVDAVNSAGNTQTTRVNNAGTDAVGAVAAARNTAVNAVNDAGRTQVEAVTEEGTRQKAAAKEQADAAADSAREAGTARDGAVAAKDRAEEVLRSIPPDYSELSGDVSDLEEFLVGAATENTAQTLLGNEEEFTFWFGFFLDLLDNLTDNLVASVQAEIDKLPQDENGQAIAASIAEGNSWLQMLLHEVPGNTVTGGNG